MSAGRSTLPSRGLLSINFEKRADSRAPINIEVRLTDRYGVGYTVDLDEHQFARLMANSVVEVVIGQVL